MNCFKCEKELTSFQPNQPYDAVSFTSYGQYGSQVFDPMDHSFLEIHICDDCLTKAGDSGFVSIAQTTENLYVPVKYPNGNIVDTLVGSIRTGHYIPIQWDKDLPFLHERKFVISDVDELRREWDRIKSSFPFEEIEALILESQNI
jgi:hypothetical protein